MGRFCQCVGSNSGTERSNNPYKTFQTAMRGSLGPKTMDNLVYTDANVRFIGDRIYTVYDVDDDILTTRKYVRKSKEEEKEEKQEQIDDDMSIPFIEDVQD